MKIFGGNPRTARRRSAELHSAVSQICNLQIVRLDAGVRENQLDPRRKVACKTPPFRANARPADYKSAIQQIKNLRYAFGAPVSKLYLGNPSPTLPGLPQATGLSAPGNFACHYESRV